MADMIHHKKFSIDRGHIRIDISLSRYADRIPAAQWWLGEQVLQACRAVMPLQTGSLQQRSQTDGPHKHLIDVSQVQDGGARVLFPGPYARYLYMGYVMVDRQTGRGPRKIPVGPGGDFVLRFRKGAKLVPTARKLDYSRREAVDHWFDEAKARNGEAWVRGVKQYIQTGRLT